MKWGGSKYVVYPNAEDSIVVTNSEGKASFEGLSPGEYKIVETVTPPGYVKPVMNDIFIKVVYDDTTGMPVITRYKEAYTGDDSNSRTEVEERDNLLGVTFSQVANAEDSAVITVGNTPGVALPNTGGPGTNLIYLLGFMFTGLAGVGLILRKRRKVT